MVAKVRLADVAHGKAAPLRERHAVAMQAVPWRMTTGRDRRRGDARHRWEDRAMVGATQALLPESMQDGRPLGRHPVGAETIATDEDRMFSHLSL